MHPKTEVFSVEIPVGDEQAMQEFQNAMDAYHDLLNDYIVELARELNCSIACASDVWYLRGRSRWTEEKEKELIRLYSIGKPPNILSGEF